MTITTEPVALKGGQWTNDPRLDRVREVDLRSLNYLVADVMEAGEYAKPRGYTWRLEDWLDQGSEGACVGFGCTHELAARPAVVEGLTNDFARTKVYWEAQKIDEWAGGAYPGATPRYEGTSVNAGLKILKSLGYIEEFRWALKLEEACWYLGYRGPLVIGVDWYRDMFGTDANGFLHASGNIEGGHCVCVIGQRIVWKDSTGAKNWDNVDLLKSYWLIHNSWGKDWGVNGRAKIALIDVMKLWPSGDFACISGRVVEPDNG